MYSEQDAVGGIKVLVLIEILTLLRRDQLENFQGYGVRYLKPCTSCYRRRLGVCSAELPRRNRSPWL